MKVRFATSFGSSDKMSVVYMSCARGHTMCLAKQPSSDMTKNQHDWVSCRCHIDTLNVTAWHALALLTASQDDGVASTHRRCGMDTP